MRGTTVVEWELVAILLTLIGGFGSMAYLLGRRNSDMDQVQREVVDVKKNQAAHESDCKEREATRQRESQGFREKLAEGSVKFALLEDGQERLEQGQAHMIRLLEGK